VTILAAYRIETGTPEGDALGFTESLFSGWLEMAENNRLYHGWNRATMSGW
jgi:hypothetical protein